MESTPSNSETVNTACETLGLVASPAEKRNETKRALFEVATGSESSQSQAVKVIDNKTVIRS